MVNAVGNMRDDDSTPPFVDIQYLASHCAFCLSSCIGAAIAGPSHVLMVGGSEVASAC